MSHDLTKSAPKAGALQANKIGFWSVFALVTGSQIGSGVFMLPANLAPFGLYSLAGWFISGMGAIFLAMVFAGLCSRFPKTGGPHVYVKTAFGDVAGFFTGWTYWVISWVSTTAVIVASIGYLSPLIGPHSSDVRLLMEIGLLILISLLNFKGVQAAGHAEFVLTLLKIVPLFLMPCFAMFYFDLSNFVTPQIEQGTSTSSMLSYVALLTMWGFIGLETATTPAGSIENPQKTIPRAIVIGTICVAFLYFFNCLGIMGVIPGAQLIASKAPYVDAASIIFGGNWSKLISFIASIICIGTLNAWVLSSGQIALGLAEDGLMPALFKKKNKDDAPYWGIFFSTAGILPLLIFTHDENLATQISLIIDFSVVAFLFVYLVCCMSFAKVLFTTKENNQGLYKFCVVFASLFCGWVIFETPITTSLISLSFVFSGIPIFLFMRLKKSIE